MNLAKPLILTIHSTLEDSGLTNVILNLCRCLNYNKFDMHIITLSPEPKNSKWGEFEKLPIKLESLNLSRVNWLIKGKYILKQRINEIKPNIIHTHSLRATSFVSNYAKSCPWIATIHGDLISNYTDTYGKIMGSYFTKKELNAIKKADMKIACSYSLQKLLKRQIQNLHAIQNGVNEQVFYKPTLSEKHTLKSKFGFDKNKKIMVSVGALSNRKNPIDIIRAFNLSSMSKNTVLLFIGDGVLFEECKKIAQNANIVFLGKKTNIVEYLKVADYFISASSSEGLPNSVLEAYMTGLPCILSDIPQHREIFQQNGQAVFFKTKNYNDLLNVLNCINFEITDTFPDFSATKMTRLYEEKYTTLINKFSPTK